MGDSQSVIQEIDRVISKLFGVFIPLALLFGLNRAIDLPAIEEDLIVVVGAVVPLYVVVEAGIRGVIAHYRGN